MVRKNDLSRNIKQELRRHRKHCINNLKFSLFRYNGKTEWEYWGTFTSKLPEGKMKKSVRLLS